MTISRILVGTDFSAESASAVAHAALVADHEGQPPIKIGHSHHAPNISPTTPFPMGAEAIYADHQQALKGNSEAALAREVERCAKEGIAVTSELITAHPAAGILEMADRSRSELIVLGTHGRTGFKRILLGSVAETVVRKAACDVLVTRGDAPSRGYRRILVPVDFSNISSQVLQRAVELLHPEGIIDVIHFWVMGGGPDSYWGTVGQEIREQVVTDFNVAAASLMEQFPKHRQSMQFSLEETSPRHGILVKLEQHRYDLIVLGSHGHTGLNRYILGSVAESTVRHATIPVYVARGGLPPLL